MRSLYPVALAAGLLLACSRTPAEPTGGEPEAQDPDGMNQVVEQFRAQGVDLDLDRGTITLEAAICQRVEPLEYLLVLQPQGKDHEAMFSTRDISAEALNAAMLLLGVEKGVNGKFTATDPPPTDEQIQQGVAPYTFTPASGDGLYIYAEWEHEVGGQLDTFRFRAEDLILNIRDERTYARGRWVYLGSRFVKPHKDAAEFYAAQGEGNLVCLVNFDPANHILTGIDPAADSQSIWYPNVYMLPPIGHPVRLIFSREKLGNL